MSTKRLFFALWPNDRQRETLRNAISPVAKLVEGNAVYRSNWHVTLAFVGAFEEERIPALEEAAGAVTVEPFRLRFDRAEYWPRPKLAVLLAPTVPPELARLVSGLKAVLEDAGVAVEDRMFRPHITIVKRARQFEVQRLAQPVVIEWTDFELIESVPGHAGPDYRPVKQ